MDNPLLKDPEILDKFKKFSKRNYEIKKQSIKRIAEALDNNLTPERPNNNPDSLYRCALKVYPKLKDIQRIYAYVSCINTGKLKTINQQKLDEYHIKYDEITKKFYADKEYIKTINNPVK